MHKIALTLLAALCFGSALAQVELTLTGDINDSTFMARVAKMRAEGYKVKINEPDPLEVKHTNQPLPAFQLTDLQGRPISSDDLKGKKLHINIWSTTCKPCIEEFPELNQLKAAYEKEGMAFIAIAPESAAKITKLLAKQPLEYRVVPDAKAYLRELGVDSFPVNLFVDEAGIIRKVIHGASYKMETVDGKPTMVPDNYEKYESALTEM